MSLSRSFVALLLVALGAAAVAIWAGTNLTIALPAALLALLVAAAMVYDGWSQGATAERAVSGLPTAVSGATTDTKSASLPPLDGSRFDREEVVLLLDQVERTIRDPSLPSHRLEDLDRLATLPPEQFRDYVRRRVEALEAGT